MPMQRSAIATTGTTRYTSLLARETETGENATCDTKHHCVTLRHGKILNTYYYSS
jgi:hypothetical protein